MYWRASLLLIIIIKSAVFVSSCCPSTSVYSSCKTEIQKSSCCSSNIKCSETKDTSDDSTESTGDKSHHCSCVHISPMNLNSSFERESFELITIEKHEVNHYVSPYFYLYSSKIFQPPRVA